MRNKAYLGTIAGSKGNKGTKGRDKRDGTHHERPPEALHPAPPAPSGHHHRPKEKATPEAPATPKN